MTWKERESKHFGEREIKFTYIRCVEKQHSQFIPILQQIWEFSISRWAFSQNIIVNSYSFYSWCVNGILRRNHFSNNNNHSTVKYFKFSQ